MELFEDPAFKSKYQKSKLRVKLWESDFMEKYGRKPNKNDIKEADVTIKEAYKMYWKLKTRALEETLTDITFCDDVQGNVSNKSPRKLVTKQDKSSSPEKAIDTENIDPLNGKCDIETDSSFDRSNMTNVEGVWGDHLNRSEEPVPKKKQSLLVGRSSSFQLSRNKFESSTLIKRNPRKSLSSTRPKNKSEKIMSSDSNIDQVDLISKDGFDTIEVEAKPMFGESTKIVYEISKPVQHAVSAVQQLIDGRVTGVSRTLDQGWLDRCTKDGNLEAATFNSQRLSNTSDSGVESMESSIYSPKELQFATATTRQISDEEDFICNSDSEEERKNKRIRNFKRRFNDQNDRPAKRQCFETNLDAVTNRPISDDTIDTDTSKSPSIDHSTSNPTANDRHNMIENARLIKNTKAFNLTVDINDKLHLSNVDPSIVENDKKINNHPDINDQVNNVTEIISAVYNLPDVANNEHSSVLDEKSIKQIISRRDKKQILSDDSDPDFETQEEKNTKSKTKIKQTNVRTRTVKKCNSQASMVKTVNIRNDKKSYLKKKSNKRLKSKLKDDDEEKSIDSNEKIAIYSVEKLQTVPRFVIKSNGTDDLISQLSESISADTSKKNVSIPMKTNLTKREKLEKKIAAGTMNDNFVRINIKKKVFVRGKKNFNFSKYKKNQWKQRKKELMSSESNLDAADLLDKNGMTCFKCGESGHFAKSCPVAKCGDTLLPLEEYDDSSNFPTLADAERMASENAVIAHAHNIDRLPARHFYSNPNIPDSLNEEKDIAELFDEEFVDYDEKREIGVHSIPQELVSKLLPPRTELINPLYRVNEDNTLIKTPTEVFETLRMFGHENFRAGQEKAVMRILSGQSTLVTLSTGSGKSLCYQLPAYLYSQHSRCITLVISPLVSLMDDQVTGVPLFLSAACLHTNQSPKVREHVIESVRNGNVNILLISPEAVVAGERSTGFGAIFRQLPPIAFACIDEAHCISQWSHNFRPSYLMVCRVLKEKLGVRTVLGLTATATKATAESIAKHLVLHDGMAGVISDVPVPKNLVLTVSKDENKDQALIALLRSERFRECNSIIIYCTRREECTRIAGLLRTSLQDPRNPENPKMKISELAEAYHAGMTAYRRKIVQKEFMSGKTKIVVATVAFGMGINKSDIRSVIHYNMPGTFEGYVQEIGRSGRDGFSAHCHLFLNPTQNSDKYELRRHINANGVERHTLRHLLQRIFISCSCAKLSVKSSGRRCPGHEVALPIDETVEALDITEEMISTLLCYLELHPKKFITVLSSVYIRARVTSYNGSQDLKLVAKSSPPLAMAIALDMQKGISHENSNMIEFPVIDIASAIGWDSGVVKSHLKNMEWTTGADGKMKRSGISVRYDKLGLRVRAPGDLTDAELDEALDALTARTQTQESSCLQQLEFISSALNSASVSSIKHYSVLNDDITKKSEDLKNTIREYFQSDLSSNNTDIGLEEKMTDSRLAADVRSLIACYRDTKFTGRAVARIFHGIQSPNYPAIIWSKCRFWRVHLSLDFNVICKIATKEILALR